jgi:hypothetical protein
VKKLIRNIARASFVEPNVASLGAIRDRVNLRRAGSIHCGSTTAEEGTDMGRWQRVALAAVMALALALAAGACGGDSGGDERSDATTRAPEGTAAPATEVAARPSDQAASPTAGANAADIETLRQVRARFVASTFSAAYENRGPAATAFVPLRVYKSGEGRYRVDFAGEREGQPYTGTSIVDEGTGFSCGTGPLALRLGGSEAGVCVRDPGGSGNPIEALFGAFNVDRSIRIVQQSQRQIAGRTADCYTTRHAASGAEGTLCVDQLGVLLAIESADPNGTNIVASAVTDTASDADFVPPYEVRELPGE